MPFRACDRNRNYQVLCAIVSRDGDACWYCGRRLDFDVDVTVEHLIPRSRGGPKGALWNLALAHGRCNRAGADLRFTEKLVLRERLRAGWPARANVIASNARTRVRNKRFVKQERRGTLRVTLLELTSVPGCGVCGKITAKTIQQKGAGDPTCADCSGWGARGGRLPGPPTARSAPA